MKPWLETWGMFDAFMGRVGFGRVQNGSIAASYAIMEQDFDALERARLAAGCACPCARVAGGGVGRDPR